MQKRVVDDCINLSSLKGQNVTGSESSGEVVQVRVVFRGGEENLFRL